MTSGGVARSTPTASSRSATRARTAAKRSTRASGSAAGRWRTCGTPSSSTTTRSKAWSPASSTSTGSTERPFGFGRLSIDAGRRVRRDVRARDGVAALRGHRRPARRARDREEHRHGHRRGVGRLGRQLLVQRRRRADPGRVADDRRVPAGAAVGPPAVHRDRHRHVRRRRATTSSSASTTCSPATKASAS